MKSNLLKILLALVIFNLSLVITKAQTWKELMDSCKVYQEKQDFESALNWAKLALPLAESEFGRMNTFIADIANDLTNIYWALHQYDSALTYAKLDSSIRVVKQGAESLAYSRALSCLGAQYKGLAKFELAEKSYMECLAITRRVTNGDSPILASRIKNVAFFYSDIAKFDKAEEYYIEALEMSRRIFSVNDTDLVACILSVAVFYFERGRLKEAEPLFLEALEMGRNIFKTDNEDYIGILTHSANFFESTGNFVKADTLYRESIAIARRLPNISISFLAFVINDYAGYNVRLGRLSDAETYYKEALEIYRRIYKANNQNLSTTMQNLGTVYYMQAKYSDAETLFLEALDMNRKIFENDHPNIFYCLFSLGDFYATIGKFMEAENFSKESLALAKRIFRANHPNVSIAINSLANLYRTMGRYSEANSLYEQALVINRQIYKKDHYNLAMSINNLGISYLFCDRLDDAESLIKESNEMFKRIYKNDHPNLAQSIKTLASVMRYKGDNNKAEILYQEAIEMYRRLYKTENPHFAETLSELAGFYSSINNLTNAEKYYKEAVDQYSHLFNKDNLYLAQEHFNLGMIYYKMEQVDNAERIFINDLKVFLNILKYVFPSQSLKEKEQFLRKVIHYFEFFNTFATERYTTKHEIISTLYDNQLYLKAILHNSSHKIKNRILNSGDSLLIKKFNEWSDKKIYLLKLYRMSKEELMKKKINIDSMEIAANDIEKELSIRSEQFSQSYENKKINWKLIQGLLKPDEAAVEVIRFRHFSKSVFTDTIHYAFLIVNEQTEEHPDLVLIENGKVLENEYYKEYLSKIKNKKIDNESYNRYWAKLSEKLKGYKKIYFSADGIYNKINPGTLLMPDGKYLLDIQDIQQVNSTKDLLLGYYQSKQESNIYNSAVLIGNPNFSLTEEKVKEISSKIKMDKTSDDSYEDLATARGINLTMLPGTEREIKDIEKFLKGKLWKVDSYLGDMALKSAVKSVTNPRVLHIATHGLFLEDVKKGGSELFGFGQQKMVENPLLRSGLFFTGADNYIKSDKSFKATDDENGLLTAYETMNLGLDKTELVVLSACETGLGEVQNGEGVFGLRRAFQQAGARSVLMSLWKVNDEATQELMSSFYKNWITGMTKRDAFSKAQQEVRKKYKDPYYWGAFVMVGE